MNKIKCKQCTAYFYYQNVEWGCPGGKEREYIFCPYCHEINGSEITNGWIYTYKTKI